MIDPKAIKPGDEVTVRAKIILVSPKVDGLVQVQINIPFGDTFWIDPSAIVTHTPAPREWKKGDRAMWGLHEATVVAVDGSEVWVRFDDGSSCTILLSDLTPIPQDGEQ